MRILEAPLHRTLALALATLLSVAGIAQAGPGDRIERHPVLATASAAQSQTSPAVASDAAGNFVVVWTVLEAFPDTPEGIWGRRIGADGVPRGGDFRVSPHSPGQVGRDESPLVAVDPDGDFVVVWSLNNGGVAMKSILGQRYNKSGVPQGATFLVNTDLSASGVTGIAIDAAGNFAVAYGAMDPDSDHVSAFIQRYAASGSRRGNPIRLNTTTANTFAASPLIGMSASGAFAATWWQSLNGARGTMRGRRFNASGVPIGNEFAVSATSSSNITSQMMSMDPTGKFVVAFNRWTLGGPLGSVSTGVFARRFNVSAVPQGGEFKVSAGGNVQSRNVTGLAMDGDGDFVLSWVGNDTPAGGVLSLHLRLFRATGAALTADNAFSFPEGGSPPTTGPVAMDGVGNFVTVAQQNGDNPDGTGIGPNLFFQRFAGPQDTRPGCSLFIANKAGTPRNDVITGTSGEDVISALGGDDIVHAGGGADIVCGGDGNDQLFGEGGADRLLGGAGDDVMDGGAGQDVCSGETHINRDTALACEDVRGVP